MTPTPQVKIKILFSIHTYAANLDLGLVPIHLTKIWERSRFRFVCHKQWSHEDFFSGISGKFPEFREFRDWEFRDFMSGIPEIEETLRS